MQRLAPALFASAILFPCAAPAAVSISPAQKSAICGKRSSCAVTVVHRAGSASIAEIHLGLKDKADDAPDDGCITGNGDKKDGGTEYWLIGAKPVQVLALCNDGYGASGVGEDHVTFANNRMVHEQEGGSAWRWTTKDVYSLTPLRLLTTEGCSYNDLGTETGTVTFADHRNFRIVSVAKNPSAHWTDNDGVGCPEVTPAMFASPKQYPGPKLVTTFPVPSPHNGEIDFAAVPSGTTMGSCSLRLNTDGGQGFLVFGKPADASEAAEIRVLSPTSNSLMVQIYDPAAAPAPEGRSWISGAHLEVWGGSSDSNGPGPLKRSDLSQIAIDLDGTVHAIGKAEVPKVEHWQAKDENGRAVTVLLLRWADPGAYAVGKAVSYSQAANGRQARMVATVPMVHGIPVFIPGGGGMETKCKISGRRIQID